MRISLARREVGGGVVAWTAAEEVGICAARQCVLPAFTKKAIITVMAVERVVPISAYQTVITIVAIEHVATNIAIQRVVVIAAGEQLAAKGGIPHGIYFFPLPAVHTTESLLTSLLNGLGVAMPARSTHQESLLNHLRDRQCLLVLDNFGQLVDTTPLLGEMLATAPGLRLLVSSQLPLNLRAERRLAVSGLDYPAEGEPAANPMAYSAVRLFVESARQTDATFHLNQENEPAILQICQLVEGMPLALELAAAWVRVMDCNAIVHKISRNLDFLSLSPKDQPGRHQSMAAVFAYSWQLLPPQSKPFWPNWLFFAALLAWKRRWP